MAESKPDILPVDKTAKDAEKGIKAFSRGFEDAMQDKVNEYAQRILRGEDAKTMSIDVNMREAVQKKIDEIRAQESNSQKVIVHSDYPVGHEVPKVDKVHGGVKKLTADDLKGKDDIIDGEWKEIGDSKIKTEPQKDQIGIEDVIIIDAATEAAEEIFKRATKGDDEDEKSEPEPKKPKEKEKKKEKEVPNSFIEVQKELKKLIIKKAGTEWEDKLVEKQDELVAEAENLKVFGGIRGRVQKVFEDNDYLEAMELVSDMAIHDQTHREIDGSVVDDETKKDHHAMIKEYCEVAHLVAQYSLKVSSGQEDPRLLREISLRGWGTIPFAEQEAKAREYLEQFKVPSTIDSPESSPDTNMAQVLERLMGGIQEGTNTEATSGLLEFLKDMELSEDLDPYNVGLDMKRALNEGKFTREFILAIDAWVGLLRLNKVMEDGGGRYELVEEALRSHNKFNGFISKPGIARLLKADKGVADCYLSLLEELGIKENSQSVYELNSVFQKSGKDIEVAMKKLIDSGKDSTRVKAAYTILRVLGYPQGVGHAEDFVVKYFIKERSDGKDSDLDKEDLCIWFEEKKIPLVDHDIDLESFRKRYKEYVEDRRKHGKKCKWYDDGKGSLRDILELGGEAKFLKALEQDNKRGALFKFWEDNKKRRGALLAVNGNRNASSGLSFADRYKTIVVEVTKADQQEWLFDESPNAGSETVKRLCDESKIDKDAPTIDTTPSKSANLVADFSEIKRDTANFLNLFKINPKSPLGKILGLK